MNRRGLIVVAIITIVPEVGLVANAIGAKKHAGALHVTATNKPTLAANRAPSPHPAKLPVFAYPGDRRCAITYQTRSNSSMTWTATVTVSGQLITHAADRNGRIYRRTVRVTPGPNVFTAPVPLSRINDIGGVLYTTSASYGCSVAPYSPRHITPPKPRPHAHRKPKPHVRPIRTQAPTPTPTPVPPPPTAASCYPLSNEGTCYEPGEFCRDSDHGATGLAGDGEKIVCEDNDGWRWEPA